MSDSISALSPSSSYSNVSASKAKNQLMKEISNSEPLVGKSALIVDNALATRRALQDQLSLLGASTIRYATTTTDVFRVLESNAIDLILCEYQLDDNRTGQQLLEELRIENKMAWNTSFVMITGERKLANVMGVLEFEPDDYLIKPFTSSQLSERIIRLFAKKLALSPILKAHALKNYSVVVNKSEDIAKKNSQYSNDIFRLKIEALIGLNDNKSAELLLRQAITTKGAPWMHLAVARICTKRSDYSSAEKELKHIVQDKPECISARDMLADVLWEQNRPAEALDVLEQVGVSAMQNVDRLRKLADLAMRLNDTTKTKQYLQRVIDRTQGTSLARADDYVNLSTALISEGRKGDAEKVTQKMRQSSNSADMEVAKILINLNCEAHGGSQEKAKTLLEKALQIFEKAEKKPSPMLQISLIESCFQLGIKESGFVHARQLAARGAQKAVLDRLKASIEKVKNLPNTPPTDT